MQRSTGDVVDLTCDSDSDDSPLVLHAEPAPKRQRLHASEHSPTLPATTALPIALQLSDEEGSIASGTLWDVHRADANVDALHVSNFDEVHVAPDTPRFRSGNAPIVLNVDRTDVVDVDSQAASVDRRSLWDIELEMEVLRDVCPLAGFCRLPHGFLVRIPIDTADVSHLRSKVVMSTLIPKKIFLEKGTSVTPTSTLGIRVGFSGPGGGNRGLM